MKKLIFSMIGGWFALTATLVPVLARAERVESNVSVRAEVMRGSKSEPDLPCMQNAVEKRDNAVIAAVQTHTSVWISALTKRRNDLKTAWTLTDRKQRREAIDNAWSAFRDSRKSARDALKKSRKDAWQQFRVDAKACKAHPQEDARGEKLDQE